MKGLLLKDWFMLKKYCRIYLLFVVVFLGVSVFSEDNTFFMLYTMLLAGSIGVTLISYDERSRWDLYCNTLPCTRSIQVHEKYVFSLLLILGVGALAFVLCLGKQLTAGTFAGLDFVITLELLLTAGVLPMVLLLPVVFRWGVEKGRIAYYVVIAIGVACGMSFGMINEDGGVSVLQAFQGSFLLVLVPVVLALMLAVSWGLSLHLYRTRER